MRDSHLTCKVANKCLNVCEWVEIVEWNKRWSCPFPAVLWIVSVCEENLMEKKKYVSNCECDRNEIGKYRWEADDNISSDEKKIVDRECRLIP